MVKEMDKSKENFGDLEQKDNEIKKEKDEKDKKFIGLVMPISDNEDYNNGHWNEVKRIIEDSLEQYKKEEGIDLHYQIVSEAKSSERIIQKNIVNNLYKADLVICDVSSKNPNVMFELGMRLAFDKKVIIIKDEITSYNFDTNPIAHINYKKDLNYVNIKSFQAELINAIKNSMLDGTARGGYLDSFADIEVQNISTKSVNEEDALNIILKELKYMQGDISILRKDYENRTVNQRFTEKISELNSSSKSSDGKKNYSFKFANDGKLLFEEDFAKKYAQEIISKLDMPNFFIDQSDIKDYMLNNNPEFMLGRNIEMVEKEIKNLH